MLDLVVAAFGVTATDEAPPAAGLDSAAPVAESTRDRPSVVGVGPPRAPLPFEIGAGMVIADAAGGIGPSVGGAGATIAGVAGPSGRPVAGASVADDAGVGAAGGMSHSVVGASPTIAGVAGPSGRPVAGAGVAGEAVPGPAGHPAAETMPAMVPTAVSPDNLWLSADGSWPTIEEAPRDQPARQPVTAADLSALRATVRRAARLDVRRAARAAVPPAAGGGSGGSAAASNSTLIGRVGAGVITTGASAMDRGDAVAAELPRADCDAGWAADIDGASGSGAVEAGPGIWGWPSDRPTVSSGEPSRPRVPPAVIRGVRDGAVAHLQDAAEIVLTQWDAVEPSTIAHCWLKSTILPAGVAMDVVALHSEYRSSSRSLGSDVTSVVSLMAGCGFGERAFGDTPATEREIAVEDWLIGEDDEGVRAATVDSIVFEEGGTEAVDGMDDGVSSTSDSE